MSNKCAYIIAAASLLLPENLFKILNQALTYLLFWKSCTMLVNQMFKDLKTIITNQHCMHHSLYCVKKLLKKEKSLNIGV